MTEVRIQVRGHWREIGATRYNCSKQAMHDYLFGFQVRHVEGIGQVL